MPSIESVVFKVAVEVSDQLSSRLSEMTDLPRAADASAATDALFTDLSRADLQALQTYLDSHGFATVVAQKRLGNIAGKASKDQLREGLRLAGVSDHSSRVVDTLHDVMIAVCQELRPHYEDIGIRVNRTDLYTSATSNSVMLRRLRSSARIHTFVARMRDQVGALHSKIRMPHIGVSRSVRYDQLYVQPILKSPYVLSQYIFRLGAPGERVLVLGDPGAGKSTLAAKFAHDVAADGTGRVPFLLVLREFATSFNEGGRDLLHYLEKLCQAPYNVPPPRDGVEYLLRTGQAVVILDGLDELVQTELRRRVVSLVEGFAHLYPLVPILVTARKVGYEDAPLNTDLFVQSQIEEFDDDQVADYVTRWFKLDEGTSPAEQDQLIASFVKDSEQIRELRSNALMLTLLCAMYSSDRYLPHNLAQVYERCALMLFEQWDSKSGIDLPIKFRGRLRGAVQHLAWRMFSAAESGKPQTRTRVINALAQYLDGKVDDHDESVAMAEEFLSHCTGRAWILADVGATESEPQFGFTHRTFLEYFAAEYLVRTHRTADALWAVLKPNVEQWDVVAQIVLQLFDRNFEGGADELLAEALSNGGLGFASRALHHVAPSERIVRSIVTAALDQFVSVPLSARAGDGSLDSVAADLPLAECLGDSSPMNRHVIERTVVERLEAMISKGVVSATLAIDTMTDIASVTGDNVWNMVQRDLALRYSEKLWDLRSLTPWAIWSTDNSWALKAAIDHAGVTALYGGCEVIGTYYPCAAEELVMKAESTFSVTEADSIAAILTAQPTPWMSQNRFLESSWRSELLEHTDRLRMMLSLPRLEMLGRRELLDSWHNTDVVEPVREFLLAWERGEISVLAQDQ